MTFFKVYLISKVNMIGRYILETKLNIYHGNLHRPS